MTHRHTLRVRYGECDMQGVVFNAHYLAYCDDALTAWMAAAVPDAVPYFGSPSPTFDYMVKKAELTWTAPFRFGDVVDLDCSVVRWGTTSFDVHVRGTVDGDERFSADFVQVSVTPGHEHPGRGARAREGGAVGRLTRLGQTQRIQRPCGWHRASRTAVRRPPRHRTSTSEVGRFGSSPWTSPPGSSGHNAGFSAYTHDTSCSAAAPSRAATNCRRSSGVR